MSIVENLKRADKKEADLKIIDNIAKYAKNSIEREYRKIPCNHEVVVKFYGSYQAEKKNNPDYSCLGCYKRDDIAFKFDENKSYVIDLTNIDEGSTYIGEYNLLTSYLQEIARESNEKLDYDDADFIEMIEQNKEFIKIPRSFKPRGL